MDFYTIQETDKVFPGEYLLYIPKNQIVMCGAYILQEGKIRALADGRLLEDRIENFKKIKTSKMPKSRCKGCRG